MYMYCTYLTVHQLQNRINVATSVVGTSDLWDCNDYSVKPEIQEITSDHRGQRTASGGKVGIAMTSFLSGGVMAPKSSWDGPTSYTNMDGKTFIDSQYMIAATILRLAGGSDHVLTNTSEHSTTHYIH